jgi:predicted RecB family nuclease
MRLAYDGLTSSPTDLANFLACRHKVALDLLVATGQIERPAARSDPLLELLRRRGAEHERRYVEGLRAQGLTVVDLGEVDRDDRPSSTLDAMRHGADVIVQAALAADGWLGYADVLSKVDAPSPAFGAWSYEAHDTKLSRETRGGTILQLCVYSDLVGQIQGRSPECFRVVTPAGVESYRFDDFGAFYRQVKARFLEAVARPREPGRLARSPDPTDHCSVCRWFSRCNAERRSDDHLSFVAGLGRQHQVELTGRGVTTLAALAALPIPIEFQPRRGAKETYERLREQARLQRQRRESGEPTFELLEIETDFGLTQLPEPRPGDLFLDLEGDPFGRPGGGPQPGEGGREYLFGLARVTADGALEYGARWAFSDADEQTAFDAVMTDIMAALAADASIHVYHYGSYEPAAFKRLMGRYATRQADVDRLLRGRRFVDLYAVVRHALRAGVESYSIKALEEFYRFTRDVALDAADGHRQIVEVALETNDTSIVTPEIRKTVEGYNRDDCRSVLELRRWLEVLRDRQLANGATVPRPPLEPDAPTERVTERQQRIEALRQRLLAGVPVDRPARTTDQQARYLLAYLLDWHYREDKVTWWEYFRLRDLRDEELLDERDAVAGLAFFGRVDIVRRKRGGKPTGSVIDRYRYPLQDCDIEEGDTLWLRDDTTFGTVVAADRAARTLDVKKGPAVANVHPTSAFAHERISPDKPAGALFRLGERVAAAGLEASPRAAVDLLLCHTARGSDLVSAASDSITDHAVRIVATLANTALPIQGPPGSGKTYTGARMICALVAQGRRVGVTGTSHKVIRNLLDTVTEEAGKQRLKMRVGVRVRQLSEDAARAVSEYDNDDDALEAIAGRKLDVLGGTAWFWSPEEAVNAVDVLFIDEAAQMSLANALAVSQAGKSVVLLGDPQQLEQPQKGSHPDGVDVSALDQVLGGHKTMPPERGLFLPTTWRLAPRLCAFTSEMFYEGKLAPKPGLERQSLAGAGRFSGAGLFVVGVEHDGCRNASDEEADVVAGIVSELLQPGTVWIDEHAREHRMALEDILVVAPYNAQVARLEERVAGLRAGTVDRLQGQQAPVVIYSMATSRPEDAPRGLEFLYSLNRLNVATSRARCACILVANPHLFEPDCRTPRQMQLANALARYREMAVRVVGNASDPETKG